MENLTESKKLSLAIYNLAPKSKWLLRGDDYEGLEWQDETYKPSKEEVDAEILKIENDYQNNKHQRLRVYPDIKEQLDMIWHELNQNGNITVAGNWFNNIKTIKEKFPKINP